MDLRKYADCLRLNGRVIRLALANRWLSSRDFEDGYNRLAAEYNTAWQQHIRPVTDQLLAQLPADTEGPILDLGCGTGYTTKYLVDRWPRCQVTGVDLSSGMLKEAERILGNTQVRLHRQDMLTYVAAQDARSAGMIVSAWAIGYSVPSQIIRHAGRLLRPGGAFAFVVNYADTLRPVYVAFRRCMARYPQHLGALAWPRFPRRWESLEPSIQRAAFRVTWKREGQQVIPGPAPGEPVLPWLLTTGVLAGFSRMLPLEEPGPVAEYFEQVMKESGEPLAHHFVAAVLEKRG